MMFDKSSLSLFLLLSLTNRLCSSETTWTTVVNATDSVPVLEEIQTVPPNNLVKKRHDVLSLPANPNEWNYTVDRVYGSAFFNKLVDIWNPVSLAQRWVTGENLVANITADCATDMSRYMSATLKGTNWALKRKRYSKFAFSVTRNNVFLSDVMIPKQTFRNQTYASRQFLYYYVGMSSDSRVVLSATLSSVENLLEMRAAVVVDASGKHTWGIFSGSRYWVGVPNQCRGMDNDFLDWKKHENTERSEDVPPFRVSVNSVSLVLEILKPGLNGTHDVVLGLCLPATCNTRDVEALLLFAQNSQLENSLRKIDIDHIRNLSEGYSYWDDTTFYILMVTFGVVTLLVTAGTLYDIALRYQVLRREENQRNTSNMVTELKIIRQSARSESEITLSKLWAVRTHNDVCNSKDAPKPLSEALLSFSLILNASKLGSLDVGSDTLTPIHGLRFLSMLWIILVHTCLLANEVSDNRMYRTRAEEDFLYQTISNGNYAVDTFFFISGCLVSFLYFRTIAKERMREKKIIKGYTGRVLQFLGMMSYRYFRLTPPYLLIIGLIQVSMKWYHDHSIIELPALDYKTCEKFWWRNALYINTYFDMDERCMVWSWYLANDTQFYAVGIIILIIGASYFSAAALMTVFFLIASWITTAVITLHTQHVPSIQDPFAHYESLYDKPWTRIGPYLIGMMAGWILFKFDCKIKMNRAIVVLGWTLSAVTMVSIVYGLYGTMFGPILSTMYTALSHSGWALCTAWVLVACVTGYGGTANKILSWKYIYPVSRLTYCAYLVHPALLRAIILRGENSYHLSHGFVAILYFGVVVATYTASLFISLFFEAPMVSLLRIVHPLRRWKRE